MTSDERKLFDELIIASGTLATVADNAAVIISEEFDELVRPQIEAVRAVLDRCPAPQTAWDGELHEDDLSITVYRTGHEGVNVDALGVKIVHRPTGIGRQSESKSSQLQNREVAMRALREAVQREFDARKSRDEARSG